MFALAQSWCDMWNEDPNLARDLVTEDFRMWLGASPDGDPVAGPDDLLALVKDGQSSTRFIVKSVIVDDSNERFAYVWDAVQPDGLVRSGLDVNIVVDGRISRNWSISGERASTLETATPEMQSSRDDIELLCDAWSPMWNGNTALTADIVSNDFRIWFGATKSAADDARGDEDLAQYVRRHRAGRPSLHFAPHHDFVIDTAAQRAAITWTASIDHNAGESRSVGGIDAFDITNGRLSRCWSVTASRKFLF